MNCELQIYTIIGVVRESKIMERRLHRIYKIHSNIWPWGRTYDLIFDKGNGIVEVQLVDGDDVVFIRGLSVIDKYRRQGLGTAMLKYIERLAKAEGRNILQAYVDPEAEFKSNLDWYKKQGFCEVENQFEEHYIVIEKNICTRKRRRNY